MPVIHLFSARFKEKIRDVSGAHVALAEYETESDLSFVETVSIKANMEKRLVSISLSLSLFISTICMGLIVSNYLYMSLHFQIC